jgi:hypothetical protein
MPPTENFPFLTRKFGHVLHVLDHRDCASAFIEQAIDGCEENERVGIGEDRDFGGELVVVAKAQFIDSHGVVLVDDRNDAPRSSRRRMVFCALA